MISIPATVTLAALVLAGPAIASPAGLDRFGWKNRVLLVFAAPGDPAVAEQRRVLAGEREALGERDMVVLEITDGTVTTIYGEAKGLSAEALRQDAGVPENTRFAAVLIGKDGGVKLRASDPVSPQDLFGLIDSMPMRGAEIRR